MPTHGRMRAFDRDLIRGGHYGQRPCVPHLKAEHMAAPTNAANVKKVLANSEPSTHGRYCCKSPKLMSDKFLAGILNKPRSPIDVAAGSLPKSPVSLSLDDEVPHIFIRKSRLWPREFLNSVQKDFCNSIGT